MNILESVDNLIEETTIYEGSLQKRLGIRFKTIIDPKTGKSHMFQIIREKGPGMPAIRTSWNDNPNKIAQIFIPKNGRTHPAAFYHEIGHELRNIPNKYPLNPIRAEKEAWQGAKELRPDLYNMAKKDGTLQKTFGSYVDVWRKQNLKYRKLSRELDRLPDNNSAKGLMRSAVSRADFFNELGGNSTKALIDFSKKISKDPSISRNDIAKALKFARPLTRKNQKTPTPSTLLKIPNQTPEQIELYKNRGWN